MPKWNEQQLKAIHTKDKNILVSASAGSGKTTVLVARLMDLVMKDHVAIEQILAMTFTEAAANEMKKRLASELQNAYITSDNEQEKAYISKQLTNIQNAYISTIHSFCLSIIQNYYYIIGLDSQRAKNIMDNGMMVLYQQEALAKAFQIQYEKQNLSFLQLCEMFSARPENNQELSNTIMSLATLASSQTDSESWLHSLADAYAKQDSIQDIPKQIGQYFFDYLYSQEQRYIELLLRLNDVYELKYPEEVKKRTALRKKIDALPTLQDALSKYDYEAYRTAFINISHGVVPTSPEKEDKEYAQLRKQIQSLEDAQLEILYSEQEYLHNLQQIHPFVSTLVEMCMDYRHLYAALKAEHNVIDFDDMEHFALAILQANNQQIADVYREQFIEIMVDEFQDSNDVQNELVMLICKQNNVFRVGDIKQSIYGFRHAKPQLMKRLITGKGYYDDVIYLSNNYRSKKMIVDFNNELFKCLMNIEGFSCSYEKEDDVETGIDEQNRQNVPIHFHAVFHDEIKKAEGLMLSKNDLKASYIANQIIDIKEKEQRNWKEFVVLVRGNARKDNLKKVFDELNIPYFIDIKHGFYQSNAVQIILSTLRSLYQPHDDISFVATMMSPLFDRVPQEFAIAKQMKEASQSYYAYFKEHPFIGFSAFLELRKQIHRLPLSELLNLLYEVNNYYAQHTTIQEKTNLDLLFDKAIQFETTSAMGIAAFLEKIDQVKDAQTAEAIPIGSEANVVRVMSIHQSKGLQFPVVFLWSTDKQTAIEFKDFCICDDEIGIGIKHMELPQRFVKTTIPRIAMEHKKNKEELEEEMRILYVATTRAQQQMHIVDCILSLDKYKHPITMSSIYERGGYSAWILQTFFNSNSPLFKVKEVHSFWTTQLQNKEVQTYQPLSSYHKSVNKIILATASTKKATKEIQTLDLDDSSYAMEYGNNMHKMVEHLVNTTYSKDDILQLSKSLSIPLRAYDVQALYALWQQTLYQDMLKGRYEHELSFNVRSGDEIIHGFIDFISFQDDRITLVDFKSDNTNNAQDLIERYQAQIDVYRIAIQILYPKAVCTCYLYSFYLHTFVAL